jgi:hypothetical protein
MRSPVADLLADLSAAFETPAIGWYLFGARAAIVHGVARLTADVDVTVRLPDTMSTAALVAVLERHRFQPRVSAPEFFKRTRVIPFVHMPTRLPLDVVLAGPGLEDRFFERASIRLIEEVRVPVASAEDVIVMKVLAGRPKDVEDVVAIAAAHQGTLDVGYIRDTLRLIEEALGQSDLASLFEQALARSRSARGQR